MRRLWLATVVLIGLSGGWAVADYAATQGAGTTFGSVVVAGTHYVQNFLCDLAVPARCATVSAAGAVKVDGSAVTQPVSLASTTITGTVAATQSGTWTIQPGNTANTTAWLMNVGLINGVTPLMGNGATGTGSQRVTIASDNTAFSVNLGTIGGAATAANQATEIASLASIDTKVGSAIPAGALHIGTVGVAPYADGAIPYTATATGTTGATTATLAGAASVTTYICGFSIRANATAAATGNATVTGVITATLNFTQWTAPNASGLGITEMIFAPCIPASATNTSIAVVSAAPGTGGVVSVTAWGYKL